MTPRPVSLFIAYSHKDDAFRRELRTHLTPLLLSGRVELWDDNDIEAGQQWDAAIKEKLYGADLILLLISADSLASNYFYGQEVQTSLERHRRSEAHRTRAPDAESFHRRA